MITVGKLSTPYEDKGTHIFTYQLINGIPNIIYQNDSKK